jgi:hypothetical protein
MVRGLRGLLIIVTIGAAGCSGRPAEVRTEFKPSSMADAALKSYDTNGDNQLAGAELDAAPALKKYLALYDQDGDQGISREELQKRFASWEEGGVAFRRLDVRLTNNGRPLEGATITFEPESFMTDWVKPATGATDAAGLAKISVAAADLPPALAERAKNKSLLGVYVGSYKVKITHPSVKIPPEYQSGAALGEETSRDAMGPSAEIEIRTR